MCVFGDNPRTTNQYDNAVRISISFTGSAPTGSLRVTFNGHRSMAFSADITAAVRHVSCILLADLLDALRVLCIWLKMQLDEDLCETAFLSLTNIESAKCQVAASTAV